MFVAIGENRATKEAWLAKQIEMYDPVVRMVSSGDGEIAIHRTLKDMIAKKTPPFNDDFVTMHINLWAGGGMYRVDYEQTLDKVITQGGADADEKATKLEAINAKFYSGAKGREFKWYGLITRTQVKDIGDLPKEARIAPLCDILRTLLHIDGRIVHFDLHHKNMAIMKDGTAVIHDVGRMKLRDFETPEAPWELVRPSKRNKRILRNVLRDIFEYPNYYMDYRQYFYIARAFMNLRKDGLYGFVPEDYPKPEPPNYEQLPVDMNPIPIRKADETEAEYDKRSIEAHRTNVANFEKNKARFETWLDEFNPGAKTGAKLENSSTLVSLSIGIVSKREELANVYLENGQRLVFHPNPPNFYMAGDTVQNVPYRGFVHLDNPFETRYHQIARIFDILSVLAALSDTKGTGRTAFYYARKTAVSIVKRLTAEPAPTATKDEVEKVVRAFLALSGTNGRGEIGTNAETEAGIKYIKERRNGPAAAFAAALEDAALAQESPEESAVRAISSAPVLEVTIKEIQGEKIPEEQLPQEDAAVAKSIVDPERGGTMSPDDVVHEAEVPPPPPEIKRKTLKEFPLEEGAVEKPADVSEPLAEAAPAAAPKEGGAVKGLGHAAITFEAHDASWDFLPTPADAAEVKAVVDIQAKYRNPDVVAYISADPQIMEKHDIVKKSPYAPYALTYVASYNCDLVKFVTDTPWKRDEQTGRLQRNVEGIPGGIKGRQVSVIENILEAADDAARNIPCLIIPRFKQTVSTLKVADGVKSMIDILKGLCVDKNFIIDDLHVDNMAVMSDGKAVTFDYDRLRTQGAEFEELLRKIDANPGIYEGLPQFAYVVDKTPRDVATLFPIYDMLAVLASLGLVCKELEDAVKLVDACVEKLKKSKDAGERTAAITELASGLDGKMWSDVVIKDLPAFKTKEEEMPLPKAKRGRGRRTFRRRGLPRLY